MVGRSERLLSMTEQSRRSEGASVSFEIVDSAISNRVYGSIANIGAREDFNGTHITLVKLMAF